MAVTWRKLESHYVPKHVRWRNMVEIEIGVLASQCLARRIPDHYTDDRSGCVEYRANHAGAAVKWMVVIEQARLKLGRDFTPVPT